MKGMDVARKYKLTNHDFDPVLNEAILPKSGNFCWNLPTMRSV